jgi:TonB family protein
MSQPKYLQIGWAVSLGLHLAVAVMFFLIVIPVKPFVEEFAELYFQTVPATVSEVKVEKIHPPTEAIRRRAGEEVREEPASQPKDAGALVKLPERRFVREDEMEIPVSESARRYQPLAKDAEERVRGVSVPPADKIGRALPKVRAGERETPGVDKLLQAGPKPKGPGVTTAPLGGASEQPFEILWEGPTREILSGPLPEYPPGISKEVRIRLEFQVLPDGLVGMITPVAKGETTLENLAMEALRTWRFNPLDRNQPQVIQSAVITFVFRLE